jgi:hypothetical protein
LQKLLEEMRKNLFFLSVFRINKRESAREQNEQSEKEASEWKKFISSGEHSSRLFRKVFADEGCDEKFLWMRTIFRIETI